MFPTLSYSLPWKWLYLFSSSYFVLKAHRFIFSNKNKNATSGQQIDIILCHKLCVKQDLQGHCSGLHLTARHCTNRESKHTPLAWECWTQTSSKKHPDIKLKMFAKPVIPLSFPREPHCCAFTFPSPPPPISLIKVLFQSCVSATTRPATSIYRYWALLQYVDLGTIIQGSSDATATTFHAPGAKCQNHFISARHWQESVGLLRHVPRYFNPHKV